MRGGTRTWIAVVAAVALGHLAALASGAALPAHALVPGIAFMYARLGPDRLLGHATRDRIHAFLEGSPGRSAVEVSRGLGIGPEAARYHLRRLSRAGLVVARRARRRVRYFPQGRAVDLLREDVLATDAARRIVEAIRSEPGVSFAGLGRTTGLSTPLVAYHVRNLAASGIVLRDARGSRACLRLAPSLGVRGGSDPRAGPTEAGDRKG